MARRRAVGRRVMPVTADLVPFLHFHERDVEGFLKVVNLTCAETFERHGWGRWILDSSPFEFYIMSTKSNSFSAMREAVNVTLIGSPI